MAAVHTHAHQGTSPGLGGKAVKWMNERLRRDQRDERQRVLESTLRYAIDDRTLEPAQLFS